MVFRVDYGVRPDGSKVKHYYVSESVGIACGFLLAALHRQLAAYGPEPELIVGIRPENVLVARHETAGYIPVEAHIIEPLGAYDIVDLKLGQQLLRARTASGYVGKAGDIVWAKLDEAQTHFFSARTEEALPVRLGDRHGDDQA